MKSFSKEELAQYNGKNGAPAYIVYKGKVYDVLTSFIWKIGRHQVVHNAGEDLTGGFEQAPHGVEMLERFPVIGTLYED
jgi:predicted heme/steroid binding protein